MSATEGAVVSGAKTAATSAVKKSIFGTKTAMELVKEGRSNKTAELIFGLKSTSNITVSGKYVNQVIRKYIKTLVVFTIQMLQSCAYYNFFMWIGTQHSGRYVSFFGQEHVISLPLVL